MGKEKQEIDKLLLLMGFFLLIGLSGGISCSQKTCRSTEASAAPDKNVDDILQESSDKKKGLVKVFKYDGSLQCGVKKGTTPVEMGAELKGIHIYNSSSLNDGLMHTQVCGSPTGKANVYEIDRSQLKEALRFGFKEWLW